MVNIIWFFVLLSSRLFIRFSRYESGLLLSMLEPVAAEYCERTVEDGDTLAVEYEGRSEICIFLFEDICRSSFEACCFFTNSDFSLEDGTVFDSSASRGAPFGKMSQLNSCMIL